jgi:hypothetical protein
MVHFSIPLLAKDADNITIQRDNRMHILLQAILLNNEGANLLQSGQYLDAALLIRRAARMAECPLQFSTNATFKAIVLSGEDGSMIHIHNQTTLLLERHGNRIHQRPPPTDESLFMYQRALMLPTQMRIASLDNYVQARHMVRCGILFAALAAPIDHALELYNAILGNVDWDRGRSIVNITMNNALWQCIILNNLAHLHHVLCEFDHSTYCLDWVREVTIKTNCLDEFEHIHADDAKDIKLNVILPQFSKFKAAPVA